MFLKYKKYTAYICKYKKYIFSFWEFGGGEDLCPLPRRDFCTTIFMLPKGDEFYL